jgi:hypothetical protein
MTNCFFWCTSGVPRFVCVHSNVQGRTYYDVYDIVPSDFVEEMIPINTFTVFPSLFRNKMPDEDMFMRHKREWSRVIPGHSERISKIVFDRSNKAHVGAIRKSAIPLNHNKRIALNVALIRLKWASTLQRIKRLYVSNT